MKNEDRYFKVNAYGETLFKLIEVSDRGYWLDFIDGKIHFHRQEVEEVFKSIITTGNEANNVANSRTFSTGSKRDNDDQKPLVNHLAPYLRLRYGYHLRKGAIHYGKGNWKLGQPTEAAIECLHRHLAKYELNLQLGLEQDEDHLSAMIFNIKLIMENEQKAGITVDHFFKLKHDTQK